jgi:hypothetical protein
MKVKFMVWLRRVFGCKHENIEYEMHIKGQVEREFYFCCDCQRYVSDNGKLNEYMNRRVNKLYRKAAKEIEEWRVRSMKLKPCKAVVDRSTGSISFEEPVTREVVGAGFIPSSARKTMGQLCADRAPAGYKVSYWKYKEEPAKGPADASGCEESL